MAESTGQRSTADAEWQRRLAQAREEVLPWIEASLPLAGLTVLEYGCGGGAVSCAVAELCERHIGVDIDPEAVATARANAAELGIVNTELIAAPIDTILERVRAFTGQVDVFLLYAVLEHMTLAERLDVLRLARAVVRADGHVIVCETPNRLVPFDHHTAQMPFFHALPADLAVAYYGRSLRTDFVAGMDSAVSDGPAAASEALVRWGWGMSYHELELVFDDLAAHTLASSYHPSLYPGRPVRWEEVQLAATLDAWRPDLPPCWSRSWLDTILSVQPLEAPPAHVRPWQLRLEYDVPGVSMLPDGLLELRPGAALPVRLPAPVTSLQVGLMSAGDASHALRIRTPGGAELVPVAVPSQHGVPTWHTEAALPAATDHVELVLPDGGCISFVGHPGPPDPRVTQGRPRGW